MNAKNYLVATTQMDPLTQAIDDNNEEVVRALLNDPQIVADMMDTVLVHIIPLTVDPSIFRVVMESVPYRIINPEYGPNPLMDAMRHYHSLGNLTPEQQEQVRERIEWFLDRGADPNKEDSSRTKPLVFCWDAETLRPILWPVLLSRGADPHIRRGEYYLIDHVFQQVNNDNWSLYVEPLLANGIRQKCQWTQYRLMRSWIRRMDGERSLPLLTQLLTNTTLIPSFGDAFYNERIRAQLPDVISVLVRAMTVDQRRGVVNYPEVLSEAFLALRNSMNLESRKSIIHAVMVLMQYGTDIVNRDNFLGKCVSLRVPLHLCGMPPLSHEDAARYVRTARPHEDMLTEALHNRLTNERYMTWDQHNEFDEGILTWILSMGPAIVKHPAVFVYALQTFWWPFLRYDFSPAWISSVSRRWAILQRSGLFDVNETDESGSTALHELMRFRMRDVEVRRRLLEQLLSYGAHINARDRNNMTPIGVAISENHVDVETLRMLHNVGIRVSEAVTDDLMVILHRNRREDVIALIEEYAETEHGLEVLKAIHFRSTARHQGIHGLQPNEPPRDVGIYHPAGGGGAAGKRRRESEEETEQEAETDEERLATLRYVTEDLPEGLQGEFRGHMGLPPPGDAKQAYRSSW